VKYVMHIKASHVQELSVIQFHCHQVSYKNSEPNDTVHQFIGHHDQLLLEAVHTNLNLKT